MASFIKVYANFALIFFFTQTSYCSWIRSSVHHGYKLWSTPGITVNATDSMECLRRCLLLHSSLCLAIRFDSAVPRCTHYTKNNVRLLKYGSSKNTVIFTERETGVYVSENVTLNETSQVCGRLGGHVMTYEEMERLFNTGAEPTSCRCGWISDGSQRKVRRPEAGCGSENDIKTCTATATTHNTWCTVNAE